MKTANKCPKCGAKNFSCESEAGTCDVDMPYFDQSDLCRERVNVAKLKKQVAKLKDKLQTSENLAFNLDCTLINARRMIHELETRNSKVRR